MARTEWQSFTYGGLIDPVAVIPPLEWEKAEIAIIRLKILNRNPIVGKTDVSKIIVREWSGYWYLYKNNYQISSGSIDYKTEQIYFDRWLWTAEIATQQLAQRVPLIETTQPEENVEELSEFLILGGEVLGNLIANLNIPVVGNILEFIVGFFENLSSEDLSYIPAPYRPDKIYVWFPVGMVELDIEFHWLGYSPIAVGGGIAEIPIEELQQVPQLPQAEEPMNPAPQISFDQLARDKGYVPIGESSFVPVQIASGLFSLNNNRGIIMCEPSVAEPDYIVLSVDYPQPIDNAIGAGAVPEKYELRVILRGGQKIILDAGSTFNISGFHKAWCNFGLMDGLEIFSASVWRIAA